MMNSLERTLRSVLGTATVAAQHFLSQPSTYSLDALAEMFNGTFSDDREYLNFPDETYIVISELLRRRTT